SGGLACRGCRWDVRCPCAGEWVTLARHCGGRRPGGRCAGRRSVGKLCQTASGGQGFGPSHPRPRRPVRPSRRPAGRGARGRTSGAHPRTGGSFVAVTAPRSVTVLGSTGSVGTQTIELVAADPERFEVRALVAGRNVSLLAEQAIALRA